MKKNFILLIAIIILLPCHAQGALRNKQLPIINLQSKIEYVNIGWWENFSDPNLKTYITKAIENNHDAKQASWKVEEYKQNVKKQFSQELPSLSVGGDYILNHVGEVSGIKNNIFAVPFTASYEADIFLKNRDKTKSSKKTYEATKFQEQSIYISLASNVATTYINIVKYDKQIELQRKLVDIKREELSREELKYKNGLSSVLILNEYKKNCETAKGDLNELLKTRDKALNQLAVLIGDSPENASTIKRNSWDDLTYKTTIPTEISSDVVFSRPDILSAEANLQKANIDVRVARKEFLPKISITGIYAFTNFGVASFGSWESTVAAMLAGASMDLFKGGQKVANLKGSKARYEQMFEAYKQYDLNALKEVNDSLLVIKQDTNINQTATKKLALQKDSNNRNADKYRKGVIAYPILLADQEKYVSLQQNVVSSKANCFINYITLYKAVGGKL